MKLATVDALTDLEHRLTDALSDALSKAECARLEFEARLAAALMAEERIVPPKSTVGRITAAPLLVAVPAGGLMKITPEDILTGGLGLVVVLFVIVGVLAWISGCAGSVFGTFWEGFSASRPQPWPSLS